MEEVTMTRRTLGLLLTLALLMAPLTLEAQPPGPRPRIGGLGGTAPAAVDAFRHGLHELGWREGDHCFLE